MQNTTEIRPLRGRLGPLAQGRELQVLETCDSTNRVARRALSAGSGPGLLVVSEAQTEGRGRLGRSWEAAPGTNLLFSLVLHPRVSGEWIPRCVLLWAAAMAETLDCRLKWPNDLQDDLGLKIGGILAELVIPDPANPETAWVILGVGLNINQLSFPGIPQATSLRRIRGTVQDRSELLQELVMAIECVDPRAPDGLSRWMERSNTLGRRVRVGAVEGLAEAIREDGALIVDGQAVLAGDVEMVSSTESDLGC